MEFNIATALTKKAKTWANKTISWEQFLAKIRAPIKTKETAAQYLRMKKEERDACKDQGGFVGGYLENGQRKKTSVKYRSLITLDADNCAKADDFRGKALDVLDLMGLNVAAALYTTHSHTPEKPRWRIVIPLASPVGPEKYEPIARKLAEKIGIEFFDPTTYEASRLMFWPSCPRDGEYICEVTPGGFLDADDILSEYEDWHDASAWPVAKNEVQAHVRELKKLGDPREKKGIVGAFCRAYSIEEAIAEFLPQIYTPCDAPNRYTYAEGSTAGGFVVYDDGQHAFSHHATDPVSGLDVNSFDLVRLNMFEGMDDNAKEGAPVTKLPSYQAMVELAGKDEKVRRLIAEENFAEADKFLEDIDTDREPVLDDNGKGKYLQSAKNFLEILAHDKGLRETVGIDEFSHRLVLKKDLPWRKKSAGQVWTDADDAQMRNYISLNYGGLVGRQLIDDAFCQTVQRNKFHQVRDWLKSLAWDGRQRAETLLIDFLGAEDTLYTREVTTKFLLAAVARVLHPGCKFDQCLVLTGAQGIGKSTLLSKLGGKWFNDSIVSLQGKDVLEQMQGAWVIELAEMQAANRAENDQVKSFISRQVDKFRVPYGKRTEEYPRQCVFAATTNDEVFLKDRTGNRRFWIIPCGDAGEAKQAELTGEYVNQVWAEVYQLYGDGKDVKLYLSKEGRIAAQQMQERAREGSEFEGVVREFLDMQVTADWEEMTIGDRRACVKNYFNGEWIPRDDDRQRDKVCALEVWCELFGGEVENAPNFKLREINTIIRNTAGWAKPSKNGRLRFKQYGIQRCFVREPTEEEQKNVNIGDLL